MKIIKKSVWACIAMEQTIIYLLMVQKCINLKQKIWNFSSSIMPRKHFKKLLVNNMKKVGLIGYVFDFSADYDAIAVDDILDIHKYLMKNNNMI